MQAQQGIEPANPAERVHVSDIILNAVRTVSIHHS